MPAEAGIQFTCSGSPLSRGRAEEVRSSHTSASMLRKLSDIPKFAVTALIIFAIINLLIGVFLRYVVGNIMDYFDLDPVPFTWVEELGEMALAWLTLIGAAIGVQTRSHFTLHVFVHNLPPTAQLW